MKPEVLAFVLLVVVAAIGAYIIYSPKSGLPEGYTEQEGFDEASRAAALQCEKSYNECLKAGSSIETCTKQSSVCLSAITNPSVSQVTKAPSTGAGTSSSAAATGTAGQTTPTPSADYSAMASAALTGVPATLSSEWNNFLKQVQTNLSSSAVKPTDKQLDLVQGAGVAPVLTATPSYTPSQTVIKPHEQVPKMLPTMTALAATDKNTQAQQIALDSVYTPSIRQMIRDDVKDVVREEVEANQIHNPYAINYESY